MKKQDGYSGLLAEPMYNPTLLSTPTEKGNWAIKRAAKTLLLFRHFALDPNAGDAWQCLAIALAEAHVPGFQPPPPKRGHPKDYDLDLTLLMLIELLKLRDGLNIRRAADYVAERGKFRQNAEALRGRYRQAMKDRHLEPLRRMFERTRQQIGTAAFVEALEAAVQNYID
jgi:hypothetical protein